MSVVLPETSSNPAVWEVFRRNLGELWYEVAPLCHTVEDPSELAAALHGEDRPDARTLPDLEALLAGWPHYDATRRAVLSGAVAYLTESDPEEASPGELLRADQEVVVDAAVRAILRRR